MQLHTIFVTVGTTKFESLIREIISDRVLNTIQKHGCEKLIIQYGSGEPVNAEKILENYNIQVEQYNFKFETVRTDILNANLVIGHAGAGTCMDILNNHRPGLIVINEELMDNHQIELALQLADEGYLYYCKVRELSKMLDTLDFGALKAYEETSNMEKFVACLNELISDCS